MRRQKQTGLSLTETIVALFIIGILSNIAWSAYDKQKTKANRSDAISALMKTANILEQCYQSQIPNSYVGCSLPADGDGVLCYRTINIPCSASSDSVDSPLGNYTISISGRSSDNYILTAAPISGGEQDGDAVLTLDAKGNKSGPWPK